jgi:S-formylglutathione hydrolase FrmB
MVPSTSYGAPARRSGSVLVAFAVIVAALALALLLSPATVAHAVPPTLPAPSSNGITLRSLTEVGGDARMLEADLSSTAIFEPIKVRIYLPADYTAGTSRYPSLYLFHGGTGASADWSDTTRGAAASIVDSSPFHGIVVMPEGGKAGWYTDWLKPTRGGFQPLW